MLHYQPVSFTNDQFALVNLTGKFDGKARTWSNLTVTRSPKVRKSKDGTLQILNHESGISTSEDEEEIEQKARLEMKNPMFPKIY